MQLTDVGGRHAHAASSPPSPNRMSSTATRQHLHPSCSRRRQCHSMDLSCTHREIFANQRLHHRPSTPASLMHRHAAPCPREEMASLAAFPHSLALPPFPFSSADVDALESSTLDTPVHLFSFYRWRGGGGGSPHPPLEDPRTHFRLLKLIDGDGHDNLLLIDLATFPLDAPPEYYALSYTWGNDEPQWSILVNAVVFRVTRNLNSFLKHVAAPRYRSCLVFIDAICINQTDVQEKEAQIGLMGRIYSSASKVIAWLGGLDWVHENNVKSAKSSLAAQTARGASSAAVRVREQQRNRYPAWLLVPALCDPFWSRLWIIQELILAKEVVIHTRKSILSIEDLAWALGVIGQYGLDDDVDWLLHGASEYHRQHFKAVARLGIVQPSYKPSVISAWRRERHKVASPRLYQCIIAFSGQGSRIQKDQVFGMLGVARSGIRPDYRISDTDLFLYTLLEGFSDIWHAGGDAWGQSLLNFYGACLLAFNLSPMHPTVHLIVRCALNQALRLDIARGPVSDYKFAYFWGEPLQGRAHGLRSQHRVLNTPYALQSGLQSILLCLIVPRDWMPVHSILHILDANWHFLPQRLLLKWMQHVDCLMPMTNTDWHVDGSKTSYLEIRMYSEWVARVEEVSGQVRAGRPPQRPGESRYKAARRTWFPRRAQIVREELGDVVDISLTVLSSILLAWCAVPLARHLDRLFGLPLDQIAAESSTKAWFRIGCWTVGFLAYTYYSVRRFGSSAWKSNARHFFKGNDTPKSSLEVWWRPSLP